MPCTGKSLHACPAPRVLLCAALLCLLSTLFVSGRAHCADVPPAFQSAYKKFSSQVVPDNLRKTVSTLAGFGSRVAGYPGEQQAEEYVKQQFNGTRPAKRQGRRIFRHGSV